MIRATFLALGAVAAFLLAYVGLSTFPKLQLDDLDPVPGMRDYNRDEAKGREIYIQNGCNYCHTQQVRPKGFGSDFERGWGRASYPIDYIYDRPHLLGSSRTGPDLANIASRQPSRDWHLAHLYQPRAVAPDSIMPPFPWLFALRETPAPGDVVVPLPEPHKPAGKVVVAKDDALRLFDYLMTLHHDYDPYPPKAKPAKPGASPQSSQPPKPIAK